MDTVHLEIDDVCDSIRGQLGLLNEQYGRMPGVVSELEEEEDSRLANGILMQLVECDRAMKKLQHALSDVRKDRSNFVAQAVRMTRARRSS